MQRQTNITGETPLPGFMLREWLIEVYPLGPEQNVNYLPGDISIAFVEGMVYIFIQIVLKFL